MCGIFGWQWRQQMVPTRDKRVVLATMLGDRNDNRGGKSWGWCALPTSQRTEFAISRGLGLIVSQAPAMATFSSLFGHTRMPTTGSVCKENSHPFEIGNIIGAHNGMVHNWSELETKYQERKKFAVDSMHIFAHLNEGKDMKELHCYGAIEWVERDRNPEHLFLCKLSDSGDLAIARTEHGIVWSSTKPALEAAMDAAELKIKEMVSVKKGHVIEIHDGEAWKTDREIEISTYYRTSYAATGGSRSYYNDHGGDDYTAWWDNAAKLRRVSTDKDECANPMCGAPLDQDGNCTVMFDEKCTGGSKALTAHNAAVTALTTTSCDLHQPPTSVEVFADPTVKALSLANCEHCKAGKERQTDWHQSTEGSSRVSFMCQGPSHSAAVLYYRTIKMFRKVRPLTTDDGLRARFHLVKRAWGWVVLDDQKPWALPDFYKMVAAEECTQDHNLRMDGSYLCASCLAEKDAAKDQGTCKVDTCMSVPDSSLQEYCTRHECADEKCLKRSMADSIFCEDCRNKRRSVEKAVQQLPVSDSKAAATDAASNG